MTVVYGLLFGTLAVSSCLSVPKVSRVRLVVVLNCVSRSVNTEVHQILKKAGLSPAHSFSQNLELLNFNDLLWLSLGHLFCKAVPLSFRLTLGIMVEKL